jgi:four helix bundle protein
MVEEDKSSGQYDLEDRVIDFSVRIVDLVEGLPDTRVGNHLANQLVRCGTSAAPNHGEAQSVESRNDFIHKMRVALKELRETRIWLRIIQRRAPSKLGTETMLLSSVRRSAFDVSCPSFMISVF